MSNKSKVELTKINRNLDIIKDNMRVIKTNSNVYPYEENEQIVLNSKGHMALLNIVRLER